jgi:hypothetical protein
VRAHEDVLDDVLGVVPRAAQQLGGVAAQRALVAPDDRGERVLTAGSGCCDKPRVAATEQVATRRSRCAVAVMSSVHVTIML